MREKKSDSAPKPHAPCFGAADVLYTRERAAHHQQNALRPAAKPGANGTAESAGRRRAVLAPLAEQISWQLKAVFTLTDLYEDTNGEGYLYEMNIYSFLSTKAVK